MPYIKKEERKQYNAPINEILEMLGKEMPSAAAGPFTYVVYRLLKFWSGKFWMRALGIGCLVCAILEMYRKEHGPYEDEKIKENGDV
jgi:hypothetical protein